MFIILFLGSQFIWVICSCDVVYADALDPDVYKAMYCKPANHGIDLDNPVGARWVHWSEWAYLITPGALEYIQSLGKAGSNLLVPGCGISAGIFGLLLSSGGIHVDNKRGHTKGTNGNLRVHLCTSESSAAYLAVIACFLESTGLGHGVIRTGKDKNKVGLFTRSYNDQRFSKLHSVYYVGKTKVLPPEVHNYISPFGFALAIMGNGRRRDNAMDLCTNNFTVDEVSALATAFDKLYGIQCTVQRNGKFPNLYFRATSMPIVRQLVQPLTHKSCYHKFGRLVG